MAHRNIQHFFGQIIYVLLDFGNFFNLLTFIQTSKRWDEQEKEREREKFVKADLTKFSSGC